MDKLEELTDAVEVCRRVMAEAKLPFLAGMLPRIRSGEDLPVLLERLDTVSKLMALRPAPQTVTKAFKATRDTVEQIFRGDL